MKSEELLEDHGYRFSFHNAVLRQLEGQARRATYSKHPEVWAHDVLGITMWSKQVEVSQSVVNEHNTMVAAGHGVGKSLLGAVLVLWWIDTNPLGEAIALTTAPSTHQVRNILWREIQKLHSENGRLYQEYLRAKKVGESTEGLPDHKLPGYVTSSATWRSDDGVMLAYGRTAPRGREGDAMQGVHGRVLALVDEAVGVSEDMIQTMGNNTSTEDDRQVLFANPTNPLSYMGIVWHDPIKSQAWNRITISVLDSPKFTDEHKTLPPETLENLTDESYVEQKKLEYGEDSANYISRVLGKWATESGMILFPDEVIAVGYETMVIPDPDDKIVVGFDVSRSEKGDFSYLYTAQEGWVHETGRYKETDEGLEWVEYDKPRKTDRRGLKIRYLDRWRGLPFFPIHSADGKRASDMAANERVHAHMTALGASELRYDSDGMGMLMGDAMLDVFQNRYTLIPVHGNGASPSRNTWYNIRAYGFSELANRMRRGEIDIDADTDESPLGKQLGSIEYKFAKGYAESILIASKDDLRSKGIKSPDAADAVNYAALKFDDSLFGGGLNQGDTYVPDMEVLAGRDIFASNSFW